MTLESSAVTLSWYKICFSISAVNTIENSWPEMEVSGRALRVCSKEIINAELTEFESQSGLKKIVFFTFERFHLIIFQSLLMA